MKKIFAALSLVAALGLALPAMADEAAPAAGSAPAASSTAPAKTNHKHPKRHAKHMKKKSADAAASTDAK